MSGGKASGECTSGLGDKEGERCPIVLKELSESSEPDEKSPSSVRGKEGSSSARVFSFSVVSGVGWA